MAVPFPRKGRLFFFRIVYLLFSINLKIPLIIAHIPINARQDQRYSSDPRYHGEDRADIFSGNQIMPIIAAISFPFPEPTAKY